MNRISKLIAIACLIAPMTVQADNTGFFGTRWDGDQSEVGYGGGVRLKTSILPILSLDIRGSYVVFDDIKLDIIPVEAALLLNIPLGSVLNPYVGAGAGYYFIEPDMGSADDEVGFFAAAGIELNTAENAGIFGEVRYFTLESDVDDAVDAAEALKDKIDFDGIGVNVGIFLNW